MRSLGSCHSGCTTNEEFLCLFRRYHAIAWLVPFFIALLPFISNRYGPAELWW